jgi:uncharacterized membrane protein
MSDSTQHSVRGGPLDAGRHRRALRWAGLALGFALGGFFDGIVLHQILQWHHLLSALDGPVFSDLSVQILADGLFHLLMYVIALAGFMFLWQGRPAFGQRGAGRLLASWALAGFGIWHVIDAVLFHWTLGLHRIRMDSETPLAWDLAWVVAFGLAPLALAWMIRRGDGSGPGMLAPATLSILCLAGAAASAWPSPASDDLVVIFAPGASAKAAAEAVAALDGRLVWIDRSSRVWAIKAPAHATTWPLYRAGALFISRDWPLAGCIRWSRA